MTSLDALPYQTYLMAYDTGRGKLYDRTRTAFLVNAAVLTELAIRGLVGDDHGAPRVLSAQPTGDAVLDDLLTRITAKRRTWKSWLRHRYHPTLALTERELAAAGVLTVTDRRFGRREVTVLDPAQVKALQDEVAAVLSNGRPVTADGAAVRGVALGLLAVTGAVRPVRLARGPGRGGGHVDELAASLDATASPMGRIIPSLRMTMVAAQGGMGGS
jgi:Golgi phosphoprotein 3 (GPP34)